jgi:hypothetical protein
VGSLPAQATAICSRSGSDGAQVQKVDDLMAVTAQGLNFLLDRLKALTYKLTYKRQFS